MGAGRYGCLMLIGWMELVAWCHLLLDQRTRRKGLRPARSRLPRAPVRTPESKLRRGECGRRSFPSTGFCPNALGFLVVAGLRAK